jgi:hypothetical protein
LRIGATQYDLRIGATQYDFGIRAAEYDNSHGDGEHNHLDQRACAYDD